MCPITIAEIWRIFYAPHLAWGKGFSHVILEADSSRAITLLHKDSIDRHLFVSMIKYVRELLLRDWEVRISHIYRETNHVVDFLASIGHSTPLGVCFFDSIPNGLGSLLSDDIAGVSFSRIVS